MVESERDRALAILNRMRAPFAEYRRACEEADRFLAETETSDDRARAEMRARWPEHYADSDHRREP